MAREKSQKHEVAYITKYKKTWQLRSANALQVEGRTTLRQSFWAVLVTFVLRMHKTAIFEHLIKILSHGAVRPPPRDGYCSHRFPVIAQYRSNYRL